MNQSFDEWTRPTSFGQLLPPLWVEAGLVLHYVCGEDEVCASLVEARDAFAFRALGIPADTAVSIATTSWPGVESPLMGLSEVKLAKYFNPAESFLLTASVLNHFKALAVRLPGDSSEYSVLLRVTLKEGTVVHVERLLDELAVFAEKTRVISAGVDLVDRFDPQESALYPRNRLNSGSATYVEEGLVCGYYWTTVFGSEIRAKLGAVPVELEGCVSTHGDLTIVRASDYPDDPLTVKRLPDIRKWLRPVLSGWMMNGRLNEVDRYLEGPMVPRSVIPVLTFLNEGNLIDADRRTSIESACDFTLERGEGRVELVVEVVEASPEVRGFVQEGLLGAVTAVVRGLEDGWLSSEPLESWNVDGLMVTAVGSDESVRALLWALDGFVGDFPALTRGDPFNAVKLGNATVSYLGSDDVAN